MEAALSEVWNGHFPEIEPLSELEKLNPARISHFPAEVRLSAVQVQPKIVLQPDERVNRFDPPVDLFVWLNQNQ